MSLFSKKEIEKAISLYDIGQLTEYLEIAGSVDTNFRVNTDRGTYFLKYINNKVNIPQFELLAPLHEYLRIKGIPVPYIHKTKNGNYLEEDFILYDYIEGDIKNSWTANEIISLTRNFASMLVALKDYPVPEFIKRKVDKYTKGYDIRYCHEYFKPKILELQIDEEIKHSIITTIDIIYSKVSLFEEQPKFLVHGDLNEMNAIFQNGENVGIIDFGGAYDPIVYDLGEFCYWFTMPVWRDDFIRERYDLILKTFEAILPLSSSEKELLPYMILRRGMMDIMLTLQWYWSEEKVPVPINRLSELTRRNNKIISELLTHD